MYYISYMAKETFRCDSGTWYSNLSFILLSFNSWDKFLDDIYNLSRLIPCLYMYSKKFNFKITSIDFVFNINLIFFSLLSSNLS
jgi:hypothetical protein